MTASLRDILDAVARGVFPPADGGTTVVAQHSPRDAGVLCFTAHSVVFTDEDPRWVYESLAAAECDALSASMNPRFLAALMERTGRTSETIDAMLVASPLPGEPPLPLKEIEDAGHPRVAYARRRRDDVRVWAADGGVLTTGRGIAGRLEVSVEVDEDVRHRGLGRSLVSAARHLVAEPLWAQIAPGNARSVRAFQSAGYLPVGSEILLSARQGQRAR
ncbi:GNAT family N-acetyltransferase [Streptomyces europaeiscabiei]|uniref:GNAT family N-acetyltransferase n=2 Tax=Streptomyces europaeiscabiei TaxID=146819 RepID=A0ABU4NPU8_9ACTN|nr:MULTISPECIES: GNAT family N-acetyltransferase [Streptomyces]MDX2531140.1 GNAT family N-acetyltransferase [Streptomyces europaeiscabiei]MDX2759239.1 GNAT family N-acetyltransferase [Streptomyces europaeiscabiei]MDX3549924.1 GNAT family N-acetyltransferase [Streptomyces europaeiscabiei]MDX3557393.1 GNAT family N-acetyltransferase [Streptomyces europaeiscabiei]MDX3672952.1 GNAT family N-acetyltransferase [Streptomyces europaeiscabiei]